MTAQFSYVALPFQRSKHGHLVAGEARECASADSAATAAEQFGATHTGAIAFVRKIDPVMGTCENGQLLRRIGDVPKLSYLLGVA